MGLRGAAPIKQTLQWDWRRGRWDREFMRSDPRVEEGSRFLCRGNSAGRERSGGGEGKLRSAAERPSRGS